MIKILLLISMLFLSTMQNILALELPELLSSIANTSERIVGFTETRTAEFLDKPLLSIGYLEFQAPASLIKKISFPEKIIQRIDGDNLSIYQQGKIQHTVSLSDHPQLAVGINAIRWVLSGNLSALNKNFKVTFSKNKLQWWIILVPSDPELVENIASILLTGEKTHISRIEIKQANGDSIITELYEQQ